MEHRSRAEELSTEEFTLLQKGDRQAFKRVFNQYVGLVQFIAARFQIHGAEADDVVQETFLKLHQEMHRFENANKIKSWIVAVTRNHIIDIKRKEAMKASHVEELKKQPNLLSQDALREKISRELELSMTRELLQEISATKGGPTFQRFYEQGLSVKDIAALQDEPISTVTSRLSRLRKKFAIMVQNRITNLRNQSL